MTVALGANPSFAEEPDCNYDRMIWVNGKDVKPKKDASDQNTYLYKTESISCYSLTAGGKICAVVVPLALTAVTKEDIAKNDTIREKAWQNYEAALEKYDAEMEAYNAASEKYDEEFAEWKEAWDNWDAAWDAGTYGDEPIAPIPPSMPPMPKEPGDYPPGSVTSTGKFIELFDNGKLNKSAAAAGKELASAKIKDGVLTVTAGKKAGCFAVWVYETKKDPLTKKTVILNETCKDEEYWGDGYWVEPLPYVFESVLGAKDLAFTTDPSKVKPTNVKEVDGMAGTISSPDKEVTLTYKIGATTQEETVVYVAGKSTAFASWSEFEMGYDKTLIRAKDSAKIWQAHTECVGDKEKGEKNREVILDTGYVTDTSYDIKTDAFVFSMKPVRGTAADSKGKYKDAKTTVTIRNKETGKILKIKVVIKTEEAKKYAVTIDKSVTEEKITLTVKGSDPGKEIKNGEEVLEGTVLVASNNVFVNGTQVNAGEDIVINASTLITQK